MKIYSLRRTFIVLQILVFALALFYEHLFASTHDYTIIFLYSLWNAISYLWLFIVELKYAPDFHPYQILALITVLFVGINGVSLYLRLIDGENLYFGAQLVNDSLYLGIIYLSLQHIILFAIFFILESRHKEDRRKNLKIADRIKSSNVDYFSWAVYFYIFVWLLRLIGLAIPLASISSVLVGLTVNGYIIALLLLTFAMIQGSFSNRARVWHWIIVTIEIAIVLNHGMKEEIIRPLVPYCIYIIISYKAGYTKLHSRTIFSMALMSAFVVFFVFPYVSIFRSISIRSGRLWSQISTTEAFTEYGKYMRNEGLYAKDDEDRGADYLISRAGSIGCNAFSIDYAKRYGKNPEFFSHCCIALIPRAIWPNKPQVVIGGMVDSLVKGESNWLMAQRSDSYGNSLSLGYIGSCYFCLGFWGALILIIVQSYFIWYIWDFMKRTMFYNLVALWMFTGLIFILLKDFESFADCGLNFVAFNLIYLFICKYIYRGPSSLAKQ